MRADRMRFACRGPFRNVEQQPVAVFGWKSARIGFLPSHHDALDALVWGSYCHFALHDRAIMPSNTSRRKGLGMTAQTVEARLALFVPLCTRDPEALSVLHNVGEHGAAEEDHVLSARRIFDPDLEVLEARAVVVEDAGEVELLHLLFQTAGQTRVHARAAGEDNVLVQLGARVDGGGLDGVEEELGHARLLDIHQMRLEHALGRLEAFGADLDDAAVGQRVLLYERCCFLCELLVEVEVVADVAQLLLDLTHRVKVGGAVEGVSAHEEQLDQVARHVATRHVQTLGEVGQGETFEDGHHVRHTVARVDHDTRLETLGIERKHGLDGDVDAVKAVLFKHDLAHLLAVLLGIHGRLGEQDLAPLRIDAQLLVESVVPHVAHVAEILDDAVLHGLVDLEVVAQLLCLCSHHDVLDLRAGVARDSVALFGSQDGSTDDRRKDVLGEVGAGITDLDKAGAVVDDDGP
ncbi:hypothetical protein L1887_59529 [Cichorium endivia]|nr:hypothetical protein L1887_59529 [Cichorium endivia]